MNRVWQLIVYGTYFAVYVALCTALDAYVGPWAWFVIAFPVIMAVTIGATAFQARLRAAESRNPKLFAVILP